LIWTVGTGAPAAVADIRDDLGALLGAIAYGTGTNGERPAGMKNPHLTATEDIVVEGLAATYANPTAFIAAVNAFAAATYAGAVIVAEDTAITNKFYVVGLDNDGNNLGEVYQAMK